jgi:hypothetical protein
MTQPQTNSARQDWLEKIVRALEQLKRELGRTSRDRADRRAAGCSQGLRRSQVP